MNAIITAIAVIAILCFIFSSPNQSWNFIKVLFVW